MMIAEETARRIVEEQGPAVYRLALARLRSTSQAEDAYQEVFLRWVRRKEPFESPEHCHAWFLRATLSVCNSHFRSAWVRHTLPLEDVPEPKDRAFSEVYHAVLSLPPKDRVMIHLFYEERMTAAEIGAALDVAEGTVRSRLSRAREKLREILKGEEDHD